ncbi:MAG: hypothetical protein E7190_01425 [Erysipelotrichaceae bacterium]|nr:hypothetical protein [Erysipelotrichaceae bacterium]
MHDMKETFYRIRADIRKEITIALAADLHDHDCTDALESLRNRKPDLIAIAGDLIYGVKPDGNMLKTEESVSAMRFLKECRKIAPVYYSPGNHEWLLNEKDIEMIRQTGAAYLDNDMCEFRPGIAVGGLTPSLVTDYRRYRKLHRGNDLYPRHGAHRYDMHDGPETDWLSRFERYDGYKILLCHYPQYWRMSEPYLYRRKIDLVLSGHAHGGQIRYWHPFRWDGLYAPGQGFLPEYTSGMHRGEQGAMIISRGLANTAAPLPRLFNPTEIVYIALQPV